MRRPIGWVVAVVAVALAVLTWNLELEHQHNADHAALRREHAERLADRRTARAARARINAALDEANRRITDLGGMPVSPSPAATPTPATTATTARPGSPAPVRPTSPSPAPTTQPSTTPTTAPCPVSVTLPGGLCALR